MIECQGWIGRKLGHNYQPTYSYGPVPANFSYSGTNLEAAIDRMRSRQYECHICTRCGHLLNGKTEK